MADRNYVAMLQGMFLDELAIDIGSVRAVQIFEERVVQNIDYQRVMPADGRVIDTHIVIGQASNGVSLFGHVVFSQNLTVQTQD
jgi:hypothetical protein